MSIARIINLHQRHPLANLQIFYESHWCRPAPKTNWSPSVLHTAYCNVRWAIKSPSASLHLFIVRFHPLDPHLSNIVACITFTYIYVWAGAFWCVWRQRMTTRNTHVRLEAESVMENIKLFKYIHPSIHPSIYPSHSMFYACDECVSSLYHPLAIFCVVPSHPFACHITCLVQPSALSNHCATQHNMHPGQSESQWVFDAAKKCPWFSFMSTAFILNDQYEQLSSSRSGQPALNDCMQFFQMQKLHSLQYREFVRECDAHCRTFVAL